MRRIHRCLNNRLREICQRTVQLEALQLQLSSSLPEALQAHCQVGSFTRGCLVIVTTDAVWASQLRYSVPELRDKLRREAKLYQLSSIKVTVATTEMARLRTTKRPTTLSTTAQATITAGAEHCQYAPLKQALYRLASAANKPD